MEPCDLATQEQPAPALPRPGDRLALDSQFIPEAGWLRRCRLVSLPNFKKWLGLP